MLNAVKKSVWLSLCAVILLFPTLTKAQGLGSSNGLFRAPNPAGAVKKANATAPKKTAPRKETVAKTVKANRNTARTVKSPAGKSNVQNQIAAQNKKPASVKQSSAASTKKEVLITAANSENNAEAQFEKSLDEGNVARDARNYTTAEKSYKQAYKIKATDFRAVYGLGNIYSDQQRWEEAEKAYRSALELEPSSPETNIALGFVLTQPIAGVELSQRYAEAEKFARRAIQLDPKNPVAYDQLGLALELRGQIKNETQNAYRTAIQLDPNFALAYAHLGRILRRNGLNTESNAAYQDAVRLASDIPTMILVADVMQSQQRYAQSEQLLRRALVGDPRNPIALFLLGRALTISGNFVEAENLLKKSVEVSPNSFVSYASLGSLYARQGDYSQAEKVLMQALQVVSANEKKRLAQEFEAVGDGWMRVGKPLDAARVYRQALSLDNEKNGLGQKLNRAEKS